MTASAFKRLASFTIDFTIIIALVFTSFRIVGNPLLREATGYDEEQWNLDWAVAARELNEERDRLARRLEEDETYTRSDYEQDIQELEDDYNEEYAAVVPSLMSVVLYFYTGWVIGNYIYQGLMKGNTFGRKWMDIELSGRVNWWSLFMREVLWKGFFWAFTLSIGIWIDFLFIAFTKDRKTLRDHISGLKVIYIDVPYPI